MDERHRGRPRDPAIDSAILAAARQMLLEVGYPALSMEAVAARAGVSKPTLYLRYPSKAALVFEAVLGKTMAKTAPDTGNVRDDLMEAYGWVIDEFAAPETCIAIPGLLAELSSGPELAQLVRSMVLDPEYERVRAVLEAGQQRGEIRDDLDLQLVIDAFTGAALARATVLDHPVDHAFGKRLVDLLLDGMRWRTTNTDSMPSTSSG